MPLAPDDTPTITSVVFVWNEISTLERVVVDQLAALRSLGVSHEVLIVDDGSTDGSAQLADALAGRHDAVRVIHHPDNRGLGEVYRTGLERATGSFVTFFPADNQFPAENLDALYSLAPSHDLVLGNLPRRTDSRLGAVLSRIERSLYRAAFGKVPRIEGVFMVRRSILPEIPLESRGRGWAIVMELVIRAARGGYRIVGAQTIMRPREFGRSKVNNLRMIRINLMQLVELRRLL